jgi:predicted ferric reductase
MMKRVGGTWWGVFGFVTLAWLVAESDLMSSSVTLPYRNLLLQYSGLLAIAWMSVAMILAARPMWPERWFGGLDKMYRLHKWVGISVLVFSLAHWLGVNAPKWAGKLGLMQRAPHGPRAPLTNPIAQWLDGYRSAAEMVGEWAFYAAVVLMIVSLVQRIPYRLFYKTHRVLAACYLALVLHTVVLTKFAYWTSPVSIVLVPLLALGSWAAVVVLLRRVGASRRVSGTITAMEYYPGVHALEVVVDVPTGWSGHEPGQFAFVTSDSSEGAHPYTMASAWQAASTRITFIVKELGDHTARLREKLRIGQTVRVEGPYGRFTFAGADAPQIWVGGGIGITPFIARMKYLAQQTARPTYSIDLFHASADADNVAFGKLQADAAAAGVRLHLLLDARDGLLTAARIRELVPSWRESSIWFCGPAGLGDTLRRDFDRMGFAVGPHFHQEWFAMR